MTMTLADQAVTARQDGRMAGEPAEKPARPKRRSFTAAYKAGILAAYDALPDGSPERGALLRKEKLYHSHIAYWRKQAREGTLPRPLARSTVVPRRRSRPDSGRRTRTLLRNSGVRL
ncbi:hypothetical protein GCM10010129_80900 [Streptomyces fumigatiscleroticus]|nr:hypothetical protein GCM10010129_80900 [Streptomyces fumigatiscleroticus]